MTSFLEKYMYENEFIEEYSNDEELTNIQVINTGEKNRNGNLQFEFIVKDRKIKLYGLQVYSQEKDNHYFIINRKEYSTAGKNKNKKSLSDIITNKI